MNNDLVQSMLDISNNNTIIIRSHSQTISYFIIENMCLHSFNIKQSVDVEGVWKPILCHISYKWLNNVNFKQILLRQKWFCCGQSSVGHLCDSDQYWPSQPHKLLCHMVSPQWDCDQAVTRWSWDQWCDHWQVPPLQNTVRQN